MFVLSLRYMRTLIICPIASLFEDPRFRKDIGFFAGVLMLFARSYIYWKNLTIPAKAGIH